MSILDTYAEQAWEFALPSARDESYLSLGLWGEAGELASLVAKSIRDETELDNTVVAKELGDVMWFLAGSASYGNNGKAFAALANSTDLLREDVSPYEATENFISALIAADLLKIFETAVELAHSVGYTLDDVLEMNIAKLQSRRDRGKITGSGDDR